MHLPNGVRKAIRYVAFVLMALVVFVFALQLTFPYDRVKDKIIDALSEKYDVTIGDVERGIIPGRLYFKSVMLRTRPTSKDETPSALLIERLEVDLGLFALIHSAASVNIDAKIGAGRLWGNITISKGGTKIDLEGTNVPSGSLPMKEVIGLPMGGKLDLTVDLDLPNEPNKAGKVGPDWTKAEGRFDLACASGCTVGDGKSKLMLKAKNARTQAFAEGGVKFGTVKVDTLVARVDIKSGKLDVTKFDLKSGDGEVHVDFSATLAQELGESLVAGCLRFKGTAELQKREPTTAAELTTTGAPQGPDGLFHIRLDGKIKDMKRLGQVCGQGPGPNMDDMSGTARKPGLPPPTPDPPKPLGAPLTPIIQPQPATPPPPPQTGSAPPPPPSPNEAAPARPPGPEGESNGSAGSAEGSAPTPPP